MATSSIKRRGYSVTGGDEPEEPGTTGQTQQPQQPQTFSQMQQQGIPRPPPPAAPAAPPPTAPPPAPPPGGGPQAQPFPQQPVNFNPSNPFGGMQPPPQPQTGGAQPNMESYLFSQLFGYQPLNMPTYSNAGDKIDTTRFESGGVGGFGGFTNPTGTEQTDLIRQSLLNPSAYTSDVAMDTFNRLRGGVDESFGVNRQLIGEEMARRGLDSSSIHGGRLGDLTIQHDRTLADLAQQIAEKQATTYGQDRASALAAALGFQGQGFSEALGGHYANLASAQENRLGKGQDFQNELAAKDFMRSGQNLGFGQGLAQAGFNANQNQRGIDNVLGYGQQQFNNQLQSGYFNQSQQDTQFNQWMELMKMLGG